MIDSGHMEMSAMLRQKDTEIETLRAQLAERDATIHELHGLVGMRETVIEEMRKQIAECELHSADVVALETERLDLEERAEKAETENERLGNLARTHSDNAVERAAENKRLKRTIKEQAAVIDGLERVFDASIKTAQDAIDIGYKKDGARWLRVIHAARLAKPEGDT